MDEAQFKAFVAINQHGSFSAAAEALHLTQPAVSKRISALEDLLDTQLFDRIGRTSVMTEAGRTLLPRAEEMLAGFTSLRESIHDLQGNISGKLSLGTSHHIGLHRLPPVLREFTSCYPNVELDLHFVDSEDGCEGVEQGNLEMAIVTLPLTSPAVLNIKKVWDDPLVLVTGKSHPLANRKKITIDELAEYDAILPGSNTYTRGLLEKELKLTQREIRTGLSTNYLETNKMMASIGLGWSILPASMVDKDLHRIKLEGIDLHRSLGYVTHRDRSLSNATRAMINILDRIS
ncbi:MAG TPA: LysR family transcriptional regulator [Gammaproteobacteria bacterium]|nr:LysR family transcriptional regulator [Gammaproteobacteria bacterium]